ncbi:MAG: RIO1 family regulatory kinase/ATPase [Thermoplasmata archaeon]
MKRIDEELEKFRIRTRLEGSLERGLGDISAENQFESKKNNVFKILYDGKECVAKVYSEEFITRAENEFLILQECKKRKVSAPEPIELRKGAIIMTFVDGIRAYELLKKEPEKTLDQVANWLAEFHKSFDWKTCRGDCILKNFIIGEKTYGIDFEESFSGDPMYDIGQAIAHLLASDNKFSNERFSFARMLAKSYFLYSEKKPDDISYYIAEGLRHYAKYRQDGEQLRAWASNIEKKPFLF